MSSYSQPYGLTAIHPRPIEVGVFLPGEDKQSVYIQTEHNLSFIGKRTNDNTTTMSTIIFDILVDIVSQIIYNSSILKMN